MSKTFTLTERIRLAQEARHVQRRAQAQHKRTLTALSIEERARALHARLDNYETAVAIGRMLTELRVSGWRKPFLRLGITAPLEVMGKTAELARVQLDRFLDEEAPGMRERTEEVARLIEGALPTPPINEEVPPPVKAPTNGADPDDAGTWGKYG